jgi:hypothetical protein
MREGVDWALGVRGGVVTREAARTERALMTWPGRMVGGTLTLSENRLEWKRSRLAFPYSSATAGTYRRSSDEQRPRPVKPRCPGSSCCSRRQDASVATPDCTVADVVGDRSTYFSTRGAADRLVTPLHRRAFNCWGRNLLLRREGRRRMVGGPRGRRREEGCLIALAVVPDCPVGGQSGRPFCQAIALRPKE